MSVADAEAALESGKPVGPRTYEVKIKADPVRCWIGISR